MTPDAPFANAACPVCADAHGTLFAYARDVEYYSTDQSYPYMACPKCGSLFLYRPPVDQLRTIYPRNYYSYQTAGQHAGLVERLKQQLDARLFRKLLGKLKGDQLRVLDIGGGSGWLLTVIRQISDRVSETHEVDIDEGARAAAEAAGHAFHLGTVENFESDRPFDLILMLNLIEHLPDPAKVLRSMRKLLAPGGLILIKTPNVNTLDCHLFRNHNWGGFHCPRHFVLFNRESITELGNSCGLRLVRASYTQGAPQWACSILGWLGLRRWIRISSERPLYTHPLYPAVCAMAGAFDFLRAPFMATAQMFVLFSTPEAGAEN